MKDKVLYRKVLLQRRRALSLERRVDASNAICKALIPLLENCRYVLAFASLPDEVDLWPLLHTLAKKKKLLLPKIAGDYLELYLVDDIKEQLKNFQGKLLEPCPSKCQVFPKQEIACALIPGVGFDKDLRRLGYGKGHYDRLLSTLSCSTIGIGFKEQLWEGALPEEPHDKRVDSLLLR